MGWQIGFDSHWNRDIGYGVPAICDRPGCGEEIDRGLSFVCGGQPYGGDLGCGLYFCERHLTGTRKLDDTFVQVCGRCDKNRVPYDPTPDTAEWLDWKLADESWAEWRRLNPEETERIKALVITGGIRLTDQDGGRLESLLRPDGSFSLTIPEGVTSLPTGTRPPGDGVAYEVIVGKTVTHNPTEQPMSETAGPVSVWQGEMRVLGVTLHLHVLDDGTRIVEAQDMTALLEAMSQGGPVDEDEIAAFARWQRGSSQ